MFSVDMGEYALYIWLSYAVSFLAIAVLTFSTVKRYRASKAMLAATETMSTPHSPQHTPK